MANSVRPPTTTPPLTHTICTNYKTHASDALDFIPPFQHTHHTSKGSQFLSDLANPEFACAVIDAHGKKLNYRQLITNSDTAETWLHSSANEFGRLAQGVGDRIKGTDTIHFITKPQVPHDRKVTYASFV